MLMLFRVWESDNNFQPRPHILKIYELEWDHIYIRRFNMRVNNDNKLAIYQYCKLFKWFLLRLTNWLIIFCFQYKN